MDLHLIPNSSGSEIRLSVFLITSVCVGLPALVWASRLLDLHRMIRGRISVFIILLLLSDLIQLVLSLYIVTQLTPAYMNWYRDIYFQFWAGLHCCGFQLHQLVTLEGVLTLTYPLYSARIFSLPNYIIISIFVLFFSIPNAFIFSLNSFVTLSFLFSIGIGLSYLISLTVILITFTITCKASSTHVSKNTRSVFTVAMVTFIMFYLPFMLVIFVNYFKDGVQLSWFEMSVCLMSLRVISDPILCVLVSNLRDVQTSQTLTEPNADEASV